MRTNPVAAFVVKGLDKMSKNLIKSAENFTGLMKPKMEKAVNLIYDTARIKRSNGLSSERGIVLGVPVKTGRLRDSIRKSISLSGIRRVVGKVWTDLFYAKYVEYGTSKMTARPFIRPALDVNKEKLKKIFSE